MDKKTDVRDPDEKVVEIEMERLRAFPKHPFKVIGDSQMIELQDSIKKYGVNPLIVRLKIEGYYEIISGHRRKYAAEKLGYKKIPVIIRMLQDDEAVVIMVDSNLQREQITPSEKAYEEFDTEEVRKLVKRLDELDPIPLPWKSDEEALKDFWDYCEERQREERIIADMKIKDENKD